MPFLEKASGTGFQGPRYRRSIGEQFLTYLEAWKRPGWGWGMEEVGRADAWATFTACGQGLRSHSAPFRTPSPSPRSYSSLPASPQEIPAPARRNPPPAPPLPPPAGGGAGGGAGGDLEGLENSGGFFSLRETPSLPHSLSPLRFLWLGFRREGLSWGRVRVWLSSSPAAL